MACGLPVVAADVPGVSDVFRTDRLSGGTIVPPDDPKELADALGALIDNPDKARALGVAGRRRVEAEFSIPHVGRQLWEYMCKRGVLDGCT
jgi:starch synthase